MMRRDVQLRISRLSDQGRERDLEGTTPAERIGMMRQLARDAWALVEAGRRAGVVARPAGPIDAAGGKARWIVAGPRQPISRQPSRNERGTTNREQRKGPMGAEEPGLMTPDFHDMLAALLDEGVEFLLVGAFALAAHGLPRATGDIDVWVRPSTDNAGRVWRALLRFGAPLHDLTPDDLRSPDIVFQIGVEPNRIDILTAVDGVTFDEAWPNRMTVDIDGLPVPVIGRADLIRNKRASARPKDLADLAALERPTS